MSKTINYSKIIDDVSKNFDEKKLKTHNEMIRQLNEMLGDDIKRGPKVVRPDSFPYNGDNSIRLDSFSVKQSMQNSFYNRP